MSTPKLLWSMAVHGCGWTTGIGALLGAGYGIVLFATMMLSLGQFDPNSAALPMVIVTLYAILIAALFGAVVAGAIGFIAGPIGGILWASVTRLFYIPLREERPYRMLAGAAGGLYGVFALLIAVRLISTSGFAPPIETPTQALMLYVFPGLLGGAAGIFISQKVVASYTLAISAKDMRAQPVVGATKPA